jgi:hypothetical protein
MFLAVHPLRDWCVPASGSQERRVEDEISFVETTTLSPKRAQCSRMADEGEGRRRLFTAVPTRRLMAHDYEGKITLTLIISMHA